MAHAGWNRVPRQAGLPADGPAGALAVRLLGIRHLGQAAALWLWPGRWRSASAARWMPPCPEPGGAGGGRRAAPTRGSTLAAAVTVVAFREANRG
jgi:hypothetical protein